MRSNALGIAGLLLACAGLYAAPAAAQVNVDLAATNLRYSLVDLTPDDGETPWINFVSADWRPIAWTGSLAPDASGEQSDRFSEERHFEFEVSPHTQVVFEYNTHLALHAPTSDPRQSAYAAIWSHMDIGWGGGKGRTDYTFQEMGDDAYVGQQDWSGGADFSRNSYGGLSARTEGDTAIGSYYIRGEAYLYAAAAPVPEAPMPAMLAAGLGAMGLLARRRLRTGG